jgi:hypothetical protein
MDSNYFCFFCEKTFPSRPDKYLSCYMVSVCYGCYNSNHDGWAPHYSMRLRNHLEQNGIAVPDLNKDDCMPREIAVSIR